MNRRPCEWGDPPPRSPLREALSMALFVVVYFGLLVLAGFAGVARSIS